MKIISTFSLAVLLLGGNSFAGSCKGTDAWKQYMLPAYGRPHSNLKDPILLPCDTMIVRAGDTSTINPGVMLHFGPNATEKNIILVQGTLLAIGSQEIAIYLSGSISEGDFGIVPGIGPWGGIRVSETGALHFKRVRLYHAIPALESKSEDVTFKQVVMQGCMNIVDPKGQLMEINLREEKIDSLDFHTSVVKAPVAEAGTKKSKVSKSKIGVPVLWSLAAAGVLATGGGLFWYLNEPTPRTSTSPPVTSNTRPELPGTPGSLTDWKP